MQVRVKENPEDFGRCGCGRSPTGKCCGWHGLTEDAYKAALDKYELDKYKKQAQDIWFSDGSCTGVRPE